MIAITTIIESMGVGCAYAEKAAGGGEGGMRLYGGGVSVCLYVCFFVGTFLVQILQFL